MGRTIIQPIGPLYGEAVNGTVFGRPNGSIYVPATNTIRVIIPSDGYYVRKRSGDNTAIDLCTSTGVTRRISVNAESQDVTSYVQSQISDANTFLDDDTASRTYAAGMFNGQLIAVAGLAGSFTITSGTTYYIRLVLKNNGESIATSDVIEVTGWESE